MFPDFDMFSCFLFKEVYGTVSPSKFANLVFKKGDTLCMLTTGGGGYGDPLDRNPNLVLEDVDNMLISRESAAEDYGIVVRPDHSGTLYVDEEKTRTLRQKLSGRKPEYRIYGGVSVDKAFMRCKQMLINEGIVEDPYAKKIGAIVEQIQSFRQFCEAECIKKADPKRCPYYNSESLSFWSFDLLVSWTRRQCPLELKLGN